jgi:hypothetical protein
MQRFGGGKAGRNRTCMGSLLFTHVFRHWLLCGIGIQADISLHMKYVQSEENVFLENDQQ